MAPIYGVDGFIGCGKFKIFKIFVVALESASHHLCGSVSVSPCNPHLLWELCFSDTREVFIASSPINVHTHCPRAVTLN